MISHFLQWELLLHCVTSTAVPTRPARTPFKFISMMQFGHVHHAMGLRAPHQLLMMLARHTGTDLTRAVLLQGEPVIVQVGWAAVCVMFSFSLSLVVWGRSGM